MPATLESSPVEQFTQAIRDLMHNQERVMLRMCANCGSSAARHEESICPSCNREADLLCVNISRVQ